MDRVIEQPTQTDLPPGRTFRCLECGARLRSGQPHTALAPRPHQTLSLLVVHDRANDDEWMKPYVSGSHRGTTGYRPQLRETPNQRIGRAVGRKLLHPLVQGPDFVWREARD